MTKPNKQLQNEEWLRNEYLTLKKSASKIARELDCQQETVSRYLHKYNIPLRTQSEEIGGERHPLHGKHHLTESLTKMSESHKGYKHTPEWCKQHSERMSGKNHPRYGDHLSTEQKERQRATLLQTYADNPDIKDQISASRKRFYEENPEAAQEHAERIIQYYSDPIHRREQSDRLKKYYEDPEARQRNTERQNRPEQVELLSQLRKKWHAENPLPKCHSWANGAYYIKPDQTNVWLRSSYETRFATLLDSQGIEWIYEPRAFYITSLDVTYRPDFYLPTHDTWIEVKGWMQDFQRIKMTEFHAEYPDVKLMLVYGNNLTCMESSARCNIFDQSIPITKQISIWQEESKKNTSEE